MTYYDALDAYVHDNKGMDGLEQPCKYLSEEIDGVWFLRNINGLLAEIRPLQEH